MKRRASMLAPCGRDQIIDNRKPITIGQMGSNITQIWQEIRKLADDQRRMTAPPPIKDLYDDLLGISAAAKVAGVSPKTLRSWTEKGLVGSVVDHRHLYFKRELVAFVEGRKSPNAT
jgi:MerR HTH family regulatory protein